MMEPVFPEPTEPRESWLGSTEPVVNFLLTSTREQAVAGRKWVNDCYSRFPDENSKFRGRLRSERDEDYLTALDELFLHERLLSSGTVTNEEGGRGPDFRIYRDSTYLGAIEVRSIFTRQDWSDELFQHGTISDELNSRLKLGNWFLGFKVIQLERQPSFQSLTRWLKERLEELDAESPNSGASKPPPVTYTTTGVRLEFQFIRRTSAQPPRPGDRIIGPSAMVGGFDNSAERLRLALKAKVNKNYDLRGAPFAIWVGAEKIILSVEDVTNALFGDEQVSFPSMALTRARNGFFRPGRNTRLSCIFVAYNWAPWSPDTAVVVRFDNPYGSVAFPDDITPADYRLSEVYRDGESFKLDWLPHFPSIG
ncbi:hypothetical protein ACQP00_42570 [Dactylosporangium sp. CS-047395]|uniref:hypothetical protein n=1 Tax=Dactylosporangium sp. CS-047395 TaxID=3239936 RepID=UPI003D91331B